jgi:YD repeat-containing protein
MLYRLSPQSNCDNFSSDHSFYVERQKVYYCPAGHKIYPDHTQAVRPVCNCSPLLSGTDCQKTQGPPKVCGGTNPINLGTTNKYQRERDYAATGAHGVNLTRHYNSQDGREGALGIAWRHGYEGRIEGDGTEMKAVRPDGRVYRFTQEGGTWQGDPDVTDQLTATTDGWTYRTAGDQTETYDTQGRLLSITDRAGRTQTLTYDTDERLAQVTDAYGRTLSFSYDDDGRLDTLTDPIGGTTTYQYNDKRLAGVTYPDGGERQYLYENSTYPSALTGILDESGERYATWSYGEHGWATSSSHAGGADQTEVSYNSDDSVTVTNALGKQTTYHFAVYNGVPKVVSVEGHPTSSCEGANKAYSYDANGFLTSKTDWKGSVTNYTRDSEGRELTRTEAVGTPEERTITTEWHADYRLPTKITEPDKVTEFTYDTDGNLLSRQERSNP